MHGNAAPPPDLPGRFAFLIAALLWACGAHITKDRTAGPWLMAVWQRMNAISQRIQRLAVQIRNGSVPPLRAGFKLTKPRQPPTRPPIVLPNNPMWLIQVIQPTAVYGVWLQQLLADPEMPALLAAAPQLARILRPLCRALGVTPPPLPPRPKPPAAPDPAPPSPSPGAGLGCDADQGRGEACAAGSEPAAAASPTLDLPHGPSPQDESASNRGLTRYSPPRSGRSPARPRLRFPLAGPLAKPA